MRIDGISAIAVILIASFAIDRIVTGLMFLLGYWPQWVVYFPPPETQPAERRLIVERHHKLAYFVIAGILGIVVLAWFGKMRILSASGFPDVNPLVDTLITGLVLVGGADRLAGVLNVPGGLGAPKPPAQPIQVTGSLVIEDPKRAEILRG